MWNPPDPTTFNSVVWEIVKQIPAGRVSTYGQIASMIPPPDGILPPDYDRLGARWVGSAMNAVPTGSGVPWQRVINSRGEISLPKDSRSADQQRELLKAEGVPFRDSGRVDLAAYGWQGPPEAWLRERGLYPPKPLRKDTGPDQPRLF
jgi:methylated-DNA-protein-cysteine methyltransferase-like protein